METSCLILGVVAPKMLYIAIAILFSFIYIYIYLINPLMQTALHGSTHLSQSLSLFLGYKQLSL